jgi:hypothetical protein
MNKILQFLANNLYLIMFKLDLYLDSFKVNGLLL